MENKVTNKILMVLIGVLLWAPFGFAKDIYIAQGSAGAINGADCTNAYPATWFNSSSNWGSAATQINPGDTVHLCGTFTGAAGTTMLSVQGSGTAGRPITILFEANAVLTAPYWPYATGAISCNSHAFITVDGGSNGLITATANGDVLTYQQDSYGVEGATPGCSNFTVQNLHISNIYQKVEGNNITANGVGATTIGIHVQGSNSLVQNNTLDHMRYPIYVLYTSTATSNIEIKNNTATFYCVGINVGDGQAGSTLTGVKIHDNHLAGGNYLWDSDSPSLNAFHFDAIHLFSVSAGSLFTGIQVYNNLFDGIMGRDSVYAANQGGGSHVSAVVYLETVGDGALVFNNVINLSGTLNHPGDGYIYCKSSGTPTQSCRNASFYNNTIISSSGGNCAELGSTGALWKNNICSGTPTAVYPPNNGAPANYLNSVTADYNDYYQVTDYGVFDTWAGWQSKGEDPHGIQTNPNLNSTFVPNTGSPVINRGVNLTSLGISALNTDMQGAVRSATGPWDFGAYAYGGSQAAHPAAPSGLSAIVH
jgi:hypothetical protein